MLKIELRLKPTATGKQELTDWPNATFSSDFIHATAGLARFELDNQIIGIMAEGNQLCATTTDHLSAKQINAWLPEYLAGLAFNLAEAALKLKASGESQIAKFIDEPLRLQLEKDKNGLAMVAISFWHEQNKLAKSEVHQAVVMAEIGRTLQDFMVQLLQHNPRLSEQEDVKRLREQIGQLVS